MVTSRKICAPGQGILHRLGAPRGPPLVNLSLALNHALGGLDVRGYHAFNLAVPVLNALLLFGIVRRTARRIGAAGIVGRGRSPSPRLWRTGLTPPPDAGMAASGDAALQLDGALLALAVALLWAVHPLRTETVTCVIQRTELLLGFFYLLTLYCFLRSVSSAGPARWQVLPQAVLLVVLVAGAAGLGQAWRLVFRHSRAELERAAADLRDHRRASHVPAAGGGDCPGGAFMLCRDAGG
jgi:hypothetical protein